MESFDTIGALLGFGAGAVAGYGFALRAMMPAMLAAKVAPLEIMTEKLQEEINEVRAQLKVEQEFNARVQAKILGLEHDNAKGSES